MADYLNIRGQTITRHCVMCGASFTYIKGAGRLRRFCSATCRDKRGRRALRPIACRTCGEMFLPRRISQAARTQGMGVYCSLVCRPQSLPIDPQTLRDNNRGHDQRSYARVKGATLIERIPDREIFERDGWRCGICKEPVDQTLRFPHHYAVCIDHVVPLALGGQHVRDNLQCAHWICNSRKGDRLAA
jgi:5-methylcytosine-specific restriction endonuclease McrA